MKIYTRTPSLCTRTDAGWRTSLEISRVGYRDASILIQFSFHIINKNLNGALQKKQKNLTISNA